MWAKGSRLCSGVSIDEGRGFVDPPTDRAHHFLDDPQQVLFILEGDVAELQLAAAFDEDALRPVDENIVDRLVLQQRFKRTEAKQFVELVRRHRRGNHSGEFVVQAKQAAGGVHARVHAHLDAGCDLVLACHPELVDAAIEAIVALRVRGAPAIGVAAAYAAAGRAGQGVPHGHTP